MVMTSALGMLAEIRSLRVYAEQQYLQDVVSMRVSAACVENIAVRLASTFPPMVKLKQKTGVQANGHTIPVAPITLPQ